jgi:hypothetical protein
MALKYVLSMAATPVARLSTTDGKIATMPVPVPDGEGPGSVELSVGIGESVVLSGVGVSIVAVSAGVVGEIPPAPGEESRTFDTTRYVPTARREKTAAAATAANAFGRRWVGGTTG